MGIYSFNRYFKLYLKCILKNANYSFVENLSQQPFKNENVLLDSKYLYFMCLHLKFSSLFYSCQLNDIFAYEVPRSASMSTGLSSFNKTNLKYSLTNKGISSIVVYNFHILNTQERFYIFISNNIALPSSSNIFTKSAKITSITELFFAANWLEREVSELHGVVIKDKKDLRNLMLQYGDSSSPFQKSFPSIGLKEMYYNPIKDTIIQNPVSIQI